MARIERSTDASQTQAAFKVLAEVAEILTDFEGVVIVGGAVPFLLVPQDLEPHEGTVDVDVVLDPEGLRGPTDITLHDALMLRLFDQDVQRPFRYSKVIQLKDESRTVILEFLAGGVPPPDGLLSVRREDVQACVMPGLEVALEKPRTVQIPGGTFVKVASISAFLAMKAQALIRREASKRSKDAYDIIYCLRNFPGGVDGIAAELNRFSHSELLRSGMEALATSFKSTESIGPSSYSQRAESAEQERMMRREAYERVSDLFDRLP